MPRAGNRRVFVLDILHPSLVPDNTYILSFTDTKNEGVVASYTLKTTSYSIHDERVFSETFSLVDTSYFILRVRNIDGASVSVRHADGREADSSKYILDLANGRIRAKAIGDFDSTEKLTITYMYFPIYQSTYLGYNQEGDAFDGMKIYLQNDEFALIPQESGWQQGTGDAWLAGTNPPTTTNKIDLPSDIEIRFADTIVDTSITGIGGAKTPVNFTVWDMTRNQKMVFRFKDGDGSGNVSSGDDIEPLIQIPTQGGILQNLTAWTVKLSKDTSANSVAPRAGDVLLIRVRKPFREGDRFSIKTVPQTVDNQAAATSIADIYVVPNPYVATSTIEPSNNYRLGRGERRIEFVHLPPECTIRIFTMSGYLVKEIHRAGSVDNGSEFWDLRTKDGLSAAYGYYVYVVEAPGSGRKRANSRLSNEKVAYGEDRDTVPRVPYRLRGCTRAIRPGSVQGGNYRCLVPRDRGRRPSSRHGQRVRRHCG